MEEMRSSVPEGKKEVTRIAERRLTGRRCNLREEGKDRECQKEVSCGHKLI